jgi:cob(I)alamin adenosyltransferase
VPWLPSFIVSLKELLSIKSMLRLMMGKLEELNAKVDELQATLDAEQEQIATAVASLQSSIADLQSQLGTGVTDAQLQGVIDKIEAVRVDLAGTVPDAPPA